MMREYLELLILVSQEEILCYSITRSWRLLESRLERINVSGHYGLGPYPTMRTRLIDRKIVNAAILEHICDNQTPSVTLARDKGMA